jgi:tRNA 2-selenouridine synthase
LHSRERVGGWQKLVDENRRAELANELIELHYDPAYARSSHQLFTQLPQALKISFRPNDADVVDQAKALLAQLDKRSVALV